jgi:hypothetical protein
MNWYSLIYSREQVIKINFSIYEDMMEAKMEISLSSGIYAINPRRILYIEYSRRPVPNLVYPELDLDMRDLEVYKVNPRKENPGTERFYNNITIHLTDNQQITCNAEKDADATFEELKNELSRIVGG